MRCLIRWALLITISGLLFVPIAAQGIRPPEEGTEVGGRRRRVRQPQTPPPTPKSLFNNFLANSQSSDKEKQERAYTQGQLYIKKYGNRRSDKNLPIIEKWLADYEKAKARADHYQRFLDSKNDPTDRGRRTTYDLGKDYVSRFGDAEHVELKAVNEWVKGYEKAREDLYQKFLGNQDSEEKMKNASEAGKEYANKYPDDPRVQVIQKLLKEYEAKEALYLKFLKNSVGTAEQQSDAHKDGQEFLSKYQNDPAYARYVESIRRWTVNYEIDRIYRKFDEDRNGDDAKQWDAYQLGVRFRLKYGDNKKVDDDPRAKAIKDWMALYRRGRYQMFVASSGVDRSRTERQKAYELGRDLMTKFSNEDNDELRAVTKWVKSYEAAVKARADLYQKFKDKKERISDEEQKEAYNVGKKYIADHGKDPDADPLEIEFIKKWSDKYVNDRYAKFDQAARTEPAEAFQLAPEIFEYEPNSLRVYISLVEAGEKAIEKGNSYHNADIEAFIKTALNASIRAMELLSQKEVMKDTWEPFNNQDDAVIGLPYYRGYFLNQLGKYEEAVPYLNEAEQSHQRNRRAPKVYLALGMAYQKGELNKLNAEYKKYEGAAPTPESQALKEKIEQLTDRVIKLYARGAAISERLFDTQLKTKIMDLLTPLYIARHNNSDEGLLELIHEFLSN